MAKLVEKKTVETVYTLQFTEEELVRIVAYCGVAKAREAENLIGEWGKPAVSFGQFQNTYQYLKHDVLGVDA